MPHWETFQLSRDVNIRDKPGHDGEVHSSRRDGEALGVTRQRPHNVVAGRSGIAPEMAARLEMSIGGNADTWLRLQSNYDLAQIRNRATPLKVERLARPEMARDDG